MSASGFQVINVKAYDEDDNEYDLTNKIDQGTIYQSKKRLLQDLELDVDVDFV